MIGVSYAIDVSDKHDLVGILRIDPATGQEISTCRELRPAVIKRVIGQWMDGWEWGRVGKFRWVEQVFSRRRVEVVACQSADRTEYRLREGCRATHGRRPDKLGRWWIVPGMYGISLRSRNRQWGSVDSLALESAMAHIKALPVVMDVRTGVLFGKSPGDVWGAYDRIQEMSGHHDWSAYLGDHPCRGIDDLRAIDDFRCRPLTES